MNELQIFNNPAFGEIRTLTEDGKTLFCGVDAARALGYKNTRDAISRHCKGVVKRDGVSLTTNQHGTTTEQTVEMAYITEGDLYRLAAKSELPGADEFESWIFDEVLPSIRRKGYYAVISDEQLAKAIIDGMSDDWKLDNVIIPALRQGDMDQSMLVAKYMGLTANEYGGNAKLLKKSAGNSRAKAVMSRWRGRAFTRADLPEKYRDMPVTLLAVRKMSRRYACHEWFAEYCGTVYFNRHGYESIIDYLLKEKVISAAEAAGWRRALGGAYGLRPYQQECIDAIEAQPPGAYLVQMATGLGKTVTFANIPRHDSRMLILSHREELVEQPRKYFPCTYGIERSQQHSSGEEVVSASVQTLVRRLDRFDPQEFRLIVCDEAHHAAASTYRKIFDYFRPEKLIGVTATPNRGDKVRLNDIFQKIIFQRDLKWGIQNGYLCDIFCKRINIGYDLSAVHTRLGDYAPGELEAAMDGTADAIAQAYREHASGATLIFAVSVRHANEIAAKIPGAVVVTGQTKDRAAIIEAFTAGEIPCIVNCMVFTEGTDIPRVETVIVARPTQSDSLYAQMVGRGLRLYPGKDKLTLIDCVGVTGKASLCTAPSLLGLDISSVPAGRQNEVQGNLFELPLRAAAASDCPESWIRNVEIIDLWAQEQKYQTHDVNWFKMPDGSMVCNLPEQKRLTIPCPDALGMVELNGLRIPVQEALDRAYSVLQERFADSRKLWDLNQVKRWGSAEATEGQLKLIRRQCKGFDCENLTKGQASQIINRLSANWKRRN